MRPVGRVRCWWGPCRRWFCPHNPGRRCLGQRPASRASRSGTARASSQRRWALLASAKNRLVRSFHYRMEEVILMGEADVRDCCRPCRGGVARGREGRATVWRQQVVLERFATFLAGRGLDAVSEQVCVDFIANQTGVRLGSLREPVKDRAVQAVRRPVVLMADALAGRALDVDRSVFPAKDACPSGSARSETTTSPRAAGAPTRRRQSSLRTRRPAGSWPTWRTWAAPISPSSVYGTCRASFFTSVD